MDNFDWNLDSIKNYSGFKTKNEIYKNLKLNE